jgi:hypothetical protein
MSLRGAFAATKQSPVASGGCSPALQQTQCGASVAKCARNDMQRIETGRAIVHGNRELIRIYEEKVKKVIVRVWES